MTNKELQNKLAEFDDDLTIIDSVHRLVGSPYLSPTGNLVITTGGAPIHFTGDTNRSDKQDALETR